MSIFTPTSWLLAALVSFLLAGSCTSTQSAKAPIKLVGANSDEYAPSELPDRPGRFRVVVAGAELASLEDDPLAYAATVRWSPDHADVAVAIGVLRLVDGCVVGLQRPEDGGTTYLLFNPVNYRWDHLNSSIIKRYGYGDNAVNATWHVPDGVEEEQYHGGSPDERFLGGLPLASPLDTTDLLVPTECDTGEGSTWVYVD